MIRSTKPKKDMSKYENCGTFYLKVVGKLTWFASFMSLQNKFSKPSGRIHGVYWKTKYLTA
jgi:hypothetical protein